MNSPSQQATDAPPPVAPARQTTLILGLPRGVAETLSSITDPERRAEVMRWISDLHLRATTAERSLELFRPRLSERSRPLFYESERSFPPTRNIVTVENFRTWHDVHVVRPDASIVVASDAYPFEWAEASTDCSERGLTFSGEQVWHPYGIQKFAERIQGAVDSLALAELTLRWLTKHKEVPLAHL